MTTEPDHLKARFTLDFGGWTDPDIVAARLFGKLVEIASGTVTEYRSDLYRDAQKLMELMPGILAEARERGAADLWWAARTHGTILERYRADYDQAKRILGRVWGFRIIIRHEHTHYFVADFVWDTEPYEVLPLTRGMTDDEARQAIEGEPK